MTAFPVVAVTPNTRTERATCPACEGTGNNAHRVFVLGPAYNADEGAYPCGECGGLGGRERTVPTVTWMVVDQPADLEVPCPDCTDGWVIVSDNPWTTDGCLSCGGTGWVVRVYAAEEQQRHLEALVPDWHFCTEIPDHVVRGVTERRQVVRWQATTATIYPVVGIDSADEEHDVPHACLEEQRVFTVDDREVMFTGEPWAAVLRPGQWVLRLDGWEPVNPAITDMLACECGADNCVPHGVIPLSVRPGTITRIEMP